MNINVSNYRQAVSKVQLSNAAFDELLSISLKSESKIQADRLDINFACNGSFSSRSLSEELRTDNLEAFKSLVWAFGSSLGRPMVQNHLGHKIIEVYDRGGKSIEEGGRYHQTRQWAYIHNDGVSDPLPIDYLVLACGQKALLGGESILIDASAVYAELMAFADVLEELKRDFYFENRGMSEEECLFKAPILSFSQEGIPLIRYFRVYIESAHLKAQVPLTLSQVRALDFLDAVLDQSSVQHRVLLEPGQVLVSAGNKFLHTRTHFIDKHTPHSEINDKAPLSSLNRYMLRMWLRKQ